jgi:hypothetical protein
VPGGVFAVLEAGIIPTSYLASDLTAGNTYEFTVESRNSYGYSVVSESISMLCAFIPEAPTTVATTNQNDQVKISWSYPVSNGSPITSYKIFVGESDFTTYT